MTPITFLITKYNSRIETLKEFSTSKSKGSGGNYFNNVYKIYTVNLIVQLFQEAYENGIINSGEFSKFTNLKRKYIPDLLQKRVDGGEQ